MRRWSLAALFLADTFIERIARSFSRLKDVDMVAGVEIASDGHGPAYELIVRREYLQVVDRFRQVGLERSV